MLLLLTNKKTAPQTVTDERIIVELDRKKGEESLIHQFETSFFPKTRSEEVGGNLLEMKSRLRNAALLTEKQKCNNTKRGGEMFPW